MADGELQDPTRSDLFEYIVDFLCTSSNVDLVWKYADWALRKDPIVGYQKCNAAAELLILVSLGSLSLAVCH